MDHLQGSVFLLLTFSFNLPPKGIGNTAQGDPSAAIPKKRAKKAASKRQQSVNPLQAHDLYMELDNAEGRRQAMDRDGIDSVIDSHGAWCRSAEDGQSHY